MSNDERERDHEPEDRRGSQGRRIDDLDSRMLRMERRFAEIDKVVAVTEVRVQGLASTLQSRCDALDRGIQMIVKTQESIEEKLGALDGVRNRAEGGIWVVRVLGIGGVVGAILGLIKWLKG